MNALEPQPHGGESRPREGSDETQARYDQVDHTEADESWRRAGDSWRRREEIARYLDGVRSALADLPAEVVEELLEDLPAHLAEVAADSADTLTDRLGSPASYAEELRTSAGIEPPPRHFPLGRSNVMITRGRALLGAADVRIGNLIGYDRAMDFLVLLRPAWWVLRGYALGILLLEVAFGDQGIIPMIQGNPLFGLGFVSLLVIGSVRVGPLRLEPLRRQSLALGQFTTRAASALLVVALLSIVSHSNSHDDISSVNYDPWGGVEDVYPYGSDGKPLTGVFLFDQNGHQITQGNKGRCSDGVYDGSETWFTYPLCPAPGGPRTPLPSPSERPFGPKALIPSPTTPTPSGSPSTPAKEPGAGSPSGAPPSGDALASR